RLAGEALHESGALFGVHRVTVERGRSLKAPGGVAIANQIVHTTLFHGFSPGIIRVRARIEPSQRRSSGESTWRSKGTTKQSRIAGATLPGSTARPALSGCSGARVATLGSRLISAGLNFD